MFEPNPLRVLPAEGFFVRYAFGGNWIGREEFLRFAQKT